MCLLVSEPLEYTHFMFSSFSSQSHGLQNQCCFLKKKTRKLRFVCGLLILKAEALRYTKNCKACNKTEKAGNPTAVWSDSFSSLCVSVGDLNYFNKTVCYFQEWIYLYLFFLLAINLHYK